MVSFVLFERTSGSAVLSSSLLDRRLVYFFPFLYIATTL